ncbi:transferase 2, rSAM/selenodomain-associated [Robiginitalea myxolifaciens]|uniref:Transferase 2, rSAM/selenodomain-associated n=1 Tax=Robiginitalea myxolifaciens TaxID=400055 RepID=A0A1I6GAC7_9FLAO|nr:TIGR04283 family arsenosugar biosynthesis glycosyltransferase [Robiginitalea myxolifaciens]SFR39119.1 transferase 2, rSAM/selenodomain-associated [Robiginitalea myxolifaciens]
MVRISLIIPVVDEAKNLRHTLPLLRARCITDAVTEIIVVDGGSSDESIRVAREAGARVIQSDRGRAKQMNAGAAAASGELLYFLHADTLPPEGFDRSIQDACHFNSEKKPALTSGCFRLKFDWNHPVLNFFAWWTRINHPICRGGDQSLFVPKSWFTQLGGFDETYRIYEDNEFIRRLSKAYPFEILKSSVITSARKYRELGVWRLQYHFARIHFLYYLGKSPEVMYGYYSRHIASRLQERQPGMVGGKDQHYRKISPSS